MRGVRGVVQDYGRGAHPGGAVKGVACEKVYISVNENEGKDEDEWH